MTRLLIKPISLFLLTLLLITCSKELEPIEPIKINQQSQFDLPKIERPEAVDLDLIYGADAIVYWGRHGVKWRKKIAKKLQSEIETKKQIIVDKFTTDYAEEVTINNLLKHIDFRYYDYKLSYVSSFYFDRREVIRFYFEVKRSQAWLSGDIPFGSYNSGYENYLQYTCNDKPILEGLKRFDWGYTLPDNFEEERRSNDRANLEIGRSYKEDKRYILPNGEPTFIARLKTKLNVLDGILSDLEIIDMFPENEVIRGWLLEDFEADFENNTTKFKTAIQERKQSHESWITTIKNEINTKLSLVETGVKDLECN